MSRRAAHVIIAVCCGCLATTVGCSRAPKRLKPPTIDASDAGEAAMAEYDTNQDGAVAGDELKKAPGLNGAMKNLDLDTDGRITADEVTARINEWKNTKISIMSYRMSVMRNGQPLPGATVTLEPENFLGEAVKPATGKTGKHGSADLTIAEADRPEPTIIGCHCGLYKVRISRMANGKEIIPAKYNTETILGCEVAQDADKIQEGITFEVGR